MGIFQEIQCERPCRRATTFGQLEHTIPALLHATIIIAHTVAAARADRTVRAAAAAGGAGAHCVFRHYTRR